MKKLLPVIPLLAIIALLFSGCASTPDGASAGRAIAKIVAKDATFFALLEHPEWRPHFERAAADLNTLATAETLSYGTLLEIAGRLPIGELESQEARIIIGDIGILIDEFAPNGGTIISADKIEKVREFVIAMRDGINMALRQ